MKGILLAGGNGLRMLPLTRLTNKHMLPVGNKPMLEWNLEKLVKADIRDVMIITGVGHMGQLVSYFGSGSRYGCDITYKVQDDAGGIAQAMQLINGYVRDGEQFWVLLGDNISDLNLADTGKRAETVLVLAKSEQPERFGVYSCGRIIEKPTNPTSNLVVTGHYRYTQSPLFREILSSLRPSQRNELEITDLNNALLDEGAVQLHKHTGYWSDAGTMESYQKVNRWGWVWSKPTATA